MSFWYTEEGAIESVAAADRGFRYGDGLFETIAIRDGQPRLWRLHVERLANGCKRLGIPTPDDAHLASLVRNALARSGIDTERAISRLVVTAGAGTRGYRRPEGIRPGVLVEVTASQALPRRLYRDGVEVRQCRTPLARQPLLAGIKSLNRLE
ncbi:MAG: aminotransferase class IV, partial [Woeseiaceae bacterium]